MTTTLLMLNDVTLEHGLGYDTVQLAVCYVCTPIDVDENLIMVIIVIVSSCLHVVIITIHLKLIHF